MSCCGEEEKYEVIKNKLLAQIKKKPPKVKHNKSNIPIKHSHIFYISLL